MASTVGSAVKSALTRSQVLSRLRAAQAFCFDVDSTVICEEGIDELARSVGKYEEVAAETLKGMEGNQRYDVALAKRLEIINPTLELMEKFKTDSPLKLTPGAAGLFKALHKRKVATYLVSGGFRDLIIPIAERLDVPLDNIWANVILFNDDGSYKSFDDGQPTSQTGGKAKVVASLKKEHGYDPVVMVGDGATDLEARPPADLFIGFGGVAVREVVKQNADWFVTDLEAITEALEADDE